jgi:hypothetical protein
MMGGNDNMVDIQIIEDMSDTENNRHYRRYITDRFEVSMIHEMEDGLCAHVIDRELGQEIKIYTGDPLADGTVEVVDEGVVFNPPRADVEKFMIPSAQEMSPMYGHSLSRRRRVMDEAMSREHMMMPHGDDDDKMIIVLSTDPMY